SNHDNPAGATTRDGGGGSGEPADRLRAKRVIDDPDALCLTCCDQDFCNRLQDCGSVQASSTVNPSPSSAAHPGVQSASPQTPPAASQAVVVAPSSVTAPGTSSLVSPSQSVVEPQPPLPP
ncbi:hypothetical protein EGW08_005050, partial [Elysia chlorotica]